MLSREANELICRTGPGTPMGEFMRQYWIPAMLSSEVPTPDSDPLRVMLLGEKLIAFRDSTGKVGLIENHCPHRGASLFFGRNEEAGLRCVYHGWKFEPRAHAWTCPMSRRSPTSNTRLGPRLIPLRSGTASSGPTWAPARRPRRCPR